MDENQTEFLKEKQQHSLEACSIPTAFNTLHKYTDHHPHQSRHLSKKEEERPCDTKDGDSFERNKQQQQHHSISNNFGVNSKCDPSPVSVSSTSSSVVENNGKELRNQENQIHHHHHHHHHYHNHYYNYYSNKHQGAQII